MSGNGMIGGSPAGEIEFRSFHINGIRLHAACAGPEDGPLVVLLHGFPESWFSWRHQIPALAAQGFRVIAPDQRGYNLSFRPSRVRDYRLEELALDVVGLINAQGRESAYLVGHDWGAGIVWQLADRHPRVVEKAVILNVPHGAAYKRMLLRSPGQLLRSWYILMFQIPWLPERLLAFWKFAGLRRVMRKTSLPGTFETQDMHLYLEAWKRPGAITGMLNWYRAFLRHPPPITGERRVRVPVLILWGEDDAFLGRELAEPSVDMCEEGRLEIVPGATHWLQHERPELVNRLILDFLREDPERAG